MPAAPSGTGARDRDCSSGSPARIAFLIVRTSDGERLLPGDSLTACGASVRTATDAASWDRQPVSDGVLLLKRDLLDQQIIDVHGHKVVRVNDVEIDCVPFDSRIALNVVSVDVGARGAIRRLAKGVVPSFTLRALLEKIPPRVIPWQYVDLLETDPARRFKLKIRLEGLSTSSATSPTSSRSPPAERERLRTIDESRCRASKRSIPISSVDCRVARQQSRRHIVEEWTPTRGRPPGELPAVDPERFSRKGAHERRESRAARIR